MCLKLEERKKFIWMVILAETSIKKKKNMNKKKKKNPKKKKRVSFYNFSSWAAEKLYTQKSILQQSNLIIKTIKTHICN